jgi:hypothetical protein
LRNVRVSIALCASSRRAPICVLSVAFDVMRPKSSAEPLPRWTAA